MTEAETLKTARSEWRIIQKVCKQRSPRIAALLYHARPAGIEAGSPPVLIIAASHDFHYKRLSLPEQVELMEWAVGTVLGSPVRVRVCFTEAETTPVTAVESASPTAAPVEVLAWLMERGVRICKQNRGQERGIGAYVPATAARDEVLTFVQQHGRQLLAWLDSMERRRAEEYAGAFGPGDEPLDLRRAMGQDREDDPTGSAEDEENGGPPWHIDGLPDALVKAFNDSFDYAMGLRNGQVIHFSDASLSTDGQWVHLTPMHQYGDKEMMTGVDFTFERGLDVRVADIVWVADAPYGS